MNYTDGSEQGNARTFLMGALAGDLLSQWPDLADELFAQPDSEYGLGRFAQTPFDQRFSKGLDSILIPARFQQSACEQLLQLGR